MDKPNPVDLSCIMCYLSAGDKIYSKEYRNMLFSYVCYTILDGFEYEEETKTHTYPKDAYSKIITENGNIDPKYIKYIRKKFPIPNIRQQKEIRYYTDMKIVIKNGKTYDFTKVEYDDKLRKLAGEKTSVETLAEEFAFDIAFKDVNDKKYFEYVDNRFREESKYDFMGRKKELDVSEINGWKIVKYLSTGVYGAVYIVSKNGKEAVLKTFHGKKKTQKSIEKECTISKIAGELGIAPKILECGTKPPTKNDKTLQYIVMEKLEGQTVYEKYKKNVPEIVMKQIQKLINILDDNHIKHNDLHLNNIMFHRDKPYIIDYGLANIIKGKTKNLLIIN